MTAIRSSSPSCDRSVVVIADFAPLGLLGDFEDLKNGMIGQTYMNPNPLLKMQPYHLQSRYIIKPMYHNLETTDPAAQTCGEKGCKDNLYIFILNYYI
eukprot:m.334747 g.334747  ORF g.334747 m.334747 type:complete len:98 (-) comp17425_c0_seq1:51-344(-)